VIKKRRSKDIRKKNMSTKGIINYALNQLRIPNDKGINNDPISPVSPIPDATDKKKNRLKLSPPSKFEQNIRGYEIWTHEDDMILLNHVLQHLHGGGWSELEIRFNGRHSARLCYDRWKHLKSLLLRGITDKPHTPW
jgi:hypothetical protein